jgi:hypothetical protein
MKIIMPPFSVELQMILVDWRNIIAFKLYFCSGPRRDYVQLTVSNMVNNFLLNC